MDWALILSRTQFAFSLASHFIFPPLTLGLTLFIVISETAFLKTKNEVYKNLSAFAVRLLTLVFALGVATGLMLPFIFGMNWGEFTKQAGAVFGVQLAVEAVVAFTLESVFIGVLFFGRDKLKPGLYWTAAFLVFIGSHLSAFIIVAANSWMQTPAGIHFDAATGRIIMDNWLAANFNPTTVIRFLHTVFAAWMVGSFLLVACAAWYMKKDREPAAAKALMTLAGVVALVTAIAQPLLGHESMLIAEKYQPVKTAAMEGIYETKKGASLYSLGVVDEQNQRVNGIELPGMLSFFYTFSFDSEVKGLNELAPDPADRPPVQGVFQSFRIMVGAGVIALVVIALAMIFHFRGTLTRKKKSLTIVVWTAVLPFIAVITGWFTAELGRQPWAIFPLPSAGFPGLRTADALTKGLIPGYVWFSFAVFFLVYIVVFTVFFRFLPVLVRKGITPPYVSGSKS